MVANAAPITISGQGAADGNWDVTAFFCDRTTPECQAKLMSQIWYQNSPLAKVFAETTGLALGYLNDTAPQADYTPFFNYLVAGTALGWGYSTTFNPGNAVDYSGGANAQYFSVAERVPEPGTLTLFGLALAGIGILRRFKA